MIGIILPTRGLIFSEVLQGVEENRKNYETELFISSNLPIPEAQNYLVAQALANSSITHLMMVEEDTVPPARTFEKLLQSDGDIVAIDYGVSGWSCIAKDKTGDILWCGLGCTLVKREVFEKLEKPWFRTDKTLRLNDWQWIDNPAKYGSLDIWFCTKAREAGFKIKQLKGEYKHLQTPLTHNNYYGSLIHRCALQKWLFSSGCLI
mgnify:CR=1 FL=1